MQFWTVLHFRSEKPSLAAAEALRFTSEGAGRGSALVVDTEGAADEAAGGGEAAGIEEADALGTSAFPVGDTDDGSPGARVDVSVGWAAMPAALPPVPVARV